MVLIRLMRMMMTRNLTFLTLCLLPLLVQVHGAFDFWKSEITLRNQVFKGYDKTIRPALNVSVVMRSLEVKDMEVKEDAHSLLLHGALQLTWEDARLRWSLEDHEDLDRLGVDPQELWRPDLAVYNSLSPNAIPSRSQMPALVYPDGVVVFVPPVDLPLTCLLDLTYWPYDVLNCSLRAGSWVHHGHMLNLTLAEDALKFMLSRGGAIEGSTSTSSESEWEVIFANLTRHTHHLPCCTEPQVMLAMEVVVRRSAPAITWVMKTPVVCLFVMTCLLFLLPPKGSEKVMFGGLCVLLNILFLGFATTIVYKDPMHTPLIVQLVMHQVVLTVVSVVIAVLVVRMVKTHHTFPLPHALNKLTSTLSPILCLSSCTKRVPYNPLDYAMIVKSEQIELGDRTESETSKREFPEDSKQWVLLASVVDRLALIMYLAACAVTLIRFSPVLG